MNLPLDPKWIADQLALEPWHLVAIPLGTAAALWLASRLMGKSRKLDAVGGAASQKTAGVAIVVGTVAGVVIGLGMTGELGWLYAEALRRL